MALKFVRTLPRALHIQLEVSSSDEKGGVVVVFLH